MLQLFETDSYYLPNQHVLSPTIPPPIPMITPPPKPLPPAPLSKSL